MARAPLAGLCLTLVAVGCSFHSEPPERLTPDRLSEVADSVFEVVIKKPEDNFVAYQDGKRPPPSDAPYAERIDKYYGIGTAFALSPGHLVSAAHVLQLDLKAASDDYFIRDRHGKVFPIDKVTRYSQYRDLVEFTVSTHGHDFHPLRTSKHARVGDRVYTFGNAQGEGLALRDGQISSYTFEPVAGAWKDIRFSAPASPGNSGGPLLDTAGDVVGVVVRKNESENLNVAIPIGELKKLTGQTAEFFLAPSEASLPGEEKHEWRFKTALPATVGKLAHLAENNQRAFHLKQWRQSKERLDPDAFPHDPRLAAYVWHQSYTPLLGVLTKSCDGGSDQAPPDHKSLADTEQKDGGDADAYCLYPADHEVHHTKREGGPTVILTDSLADFELSFLLIPPSESLATYVQHPQKLLDTLFEAVPMSRDANEDLKVRSFGPPLATGSFVDSLGRPWVRALWRTNTDGATSILNCLPTPMGFGCAFATIQTTAETLGTAEKFEEFYAAQLPLSYEGNKLEWQRFQALGAKFLPKPLAKVHLDATGGRVQFDGGAFQLSYSQAASNDKTRFFVGMGYGLSHFLNQEIQVVRMVHTGPSQASEEFSLFPEPPQETDAETQHIWAKLTNAGPALVSTDGDGSDGDGPASVIRVLRQMPRVAGKRVVETVECSDHDTHKPMVLARKTCTGIGLAH